MKHGEDYVLLDQSYRQAGLTREKKEVSKGATASAQRARQRLPASKRAGKRAGKK
jgi:hypothetical protein